MSFHRASYWMWTSCAGKRLTQTMTIPAKGRALISVPPSCPGGAGAWNLALVCGKESCKGQLTDARDRPIAAITGSLRDLKVTATRDVPEAARLVYLEDAQRTSVDMSHLLDVPLRVTFEAEGFAAASVLQSPELSGIPSPNLVDRPLLWVRVTRLDVTHARLQLWSVAKKSVLDTTVVLGEPTQMDCAGMV